MNLSGLTNRSILGKLVRLPLRLIPKSARLPILQGRLRGKRWIVGSSDHGCWLGSYENTKRIAFETVVTKESTVFDVGAHVGFYTLLASELVGPGGRVVAFEPLPRNLRYLKEHVAMNGAANVTIVEAAVSDKDGVATFEEAASSSMGRLQANGRCQVEVVALDALLSRGATPDPKFVKMDIEGEELRALEGAKAMLERCHPTIFLATHGTDVHRDCCRFLQAIGYRLEPLDGRDLEMSEELLATWIRGGAQRG